MAEADTLSSLSPKELGRHLREVRRRKGLSLSEVARGAGLTRRELNSYEKGRIPIPESDLFVIAGSCGVEVSELREPRSTPELAAGDTPNAESEPEAAPAAPLPVPSTIEDTVAQLRRSQEVAAPSVPAVSGRRRPRALGAGDASPPPPEPANEDWSIERIDPLEAVQWPSDASISAPAAYGDPSPAEPIDVFEELARLGEPTPAPSDAVEDFETDTVEDFEIAAPDTAVEPVEWPVFDDADGEPVVVEMPAAPEELDFLASAADAPPIDVAARVESFASPWDALRGDEPAPAWGETFAAPSDAADLSFVEREDALWNDAEAEAWEPPDDDATHGTFDTYGEKPVYEWESTDDNIETPAYDWTTTGDGADTPAYEWDDTALAAEPTETFDPRFAAVAPWPEPEPELPQVAQVPWAHEPDPEATSTGFYVDWGDSTLDALGSGPDPALADFGPEPEPEPVSFLMWDEPEPAANIEPEPVDPTWETPFVWDEPEPEPEPVESGDDLPVISWRPQWDNAGAAAAVVAFDESPTPWAEAEPEPEPDGIPVAEPAPEEHFAVAGAEWELGNAVPLVEVRSTGSLVMRRADERWALADVIATPDFALEAYVDLRSGPGFGVLFRAEVDTDGRMSGYSFDIDPVYEGGGYLVREWRADRELWNPIAHVSATDPEAMHGLLAVRVTVDDDRLVASVNGTTVLTVESLKEASAERGRDGACGNRVGIQAWSSTDLVIDELRVAEH